MKARLIDVAKRAGVAPNTASTILNGRHGSWASAETRERVLLAAKELNYSPSKAALGVRLGRYNTIGLVIPDLHNPHFHVLADYLDQAIKAQGYDLIVEHTRNDLAVEQRCFQSIMERQIDGAVFLLSDPELHRAFLARLVQNGPPVVALTTLSETPLPVDTVVTDFTAGFAQAIDHLVELGHRRFVFLSALAKGQHAGNRPELYGRLLRSKGIAPVDISSIRCEHHIASARNAILSLLRNKREKHPTALIALNDIAAIGAMRAIAECQLVVPKDISVIGVDNIPVGEYLPVSLTTISQPSLDLMNRAASLLLQRINSKIRGHPSQTIFPTELVIRESTSKPRR